MVRVVVRDDAEIECPLSTYRTANILITISCFGFKFRLCVVPFEQLRFSDRKVQGRQLSGGPFVAGMQKIIHIRILRCFHKS